MGGGGGLRGDPAVPPPLPVPSPPLIPSVVQGESTTTGGVALGGGDLPGSSISFLQPSLLAKLPTQLPSATSPLLPLILSAASSNRSALEETYIEKVLFYFC